MYRAASGRPEAASALKRTCLPKRVSVAPDGAEPKNIGPPRDSRREVRAFSLQSASRISRAFR